MQRAATLRCVPLAPHVARSAPPLVPRPCCSRRRAAGASRVVRAAVSADDMPPAGCERIRVSLKKPLGLVLEQNRASLDIFVVEVLPDGSAAKDGRIAVGDQLIATSAIVYQSEEDYGGVSVKKGMSMVRLLCKGESFDTGERPSGVRAAARSARRSRNGQR